MIKIIGPKYPKDKTAINTTSLSPNWSVGLSPFHVGPVELYDGHVAKNVENAYQFCKVYKIHTDDWGEPTKEYWEWAKKGWDTQRGIRYPFGKQAIPEYTLWKGKKLGYIEARKQVYIPCYANAVRKTDAFKKLKEIYEENGKNITLWDVDGYDYLALGKTIEECIEDPTRILGHAFVLAMLLEGKL
jgi:hypothetical protein